uniref:C2H2-type domain-containing protein n=1 Tax=Oryza brachyantha TaxID=4533 RepID=J3N135_ORYBR
MTTHRPAAGRGGGGARKPPPPPSTKRRSSSFPCKVCGKRFPSQQAMAGHCRAHTRASAGAPTRTAAEARQLLLPSSPLPLPAVVTVQLALLWPLTSSVQYCLPPPPSPAAAQIGCRWLPGAFLLRTTRGLLSPCSVHVGDACSTTTSQPASAMVDAAPLQPGSGGHGGEHGRERKRVALMDGGDRGRKKGKERMDGLDLELRLHR